MNLAAFEWGRAAFAGPEFALQLDSAAPRSRGPST